MREWDLSREMASKHDQWRNVIPGNRRTHASRKRTFNDDDCMMFIQFSMWSVKIKQFSKKIGNLFLFLLDNDTEEEGFRTTIMTENECDSKEPIELTRKSSFPGSKQKHRQPLQL